MTLITSEEKTMSTTTSRPLTDGQLNALEYGIAYADEQRGAAAEIRALRAERNDLLAALKDVWDNARDDDPAMWGRVMDAIARAEREK
jgi:hypothetical protein